MMNKIGVGIIGANDKNWASQSHIPALKLIPEFELTAVSTTKMSSAQAAADKFGVKHAFDNEQDLVNCDEVDLVVVAVKVPHHYQLVKAAIDGGKMIYCEWPLGNGTKEAEELARMATDKALRNFVGTQALLLPETVYLKEVIAEGLIGEVLSSSILASGGNWTDTSNEEHLYLLNPDNGATMMSIPFGHTMAAYMDILGNYETLSATLARRRKEITFLSTGEKVPQLTDDQIIVSGILKSGTVSNVHYRAGMSAATNLHWEINGTKGDILISEGFGHYQLSPIKLQYAASGNELKSLEIPVKYLGEVAPDQPVRGLYYAYRAILADIKNNTQLVPDFNQGVSMHHFLDKIQQSASEGKMLEINK